MVKLIFCLHRLPALTRPEFLDYWLNQHGPLVRRLAPDMRVVKYAQLHSANDTVTEGARRIRAGPGPYDGVAELWFESEQAFSSLGRDPKAREAGRILLEDERKFIDLSRSPIWMTHEHVIYP